MELDNFRIIKIDEFNFVFEEKKTKEKDGQVIEEWKRHRGYYGNVEQCLKTLRDYIVGNYVNESDNLAVTLTKIETLNNSIVNCELMVKE